MGKPRDLLRAPLALALIVIGLIGSAYGVLFFAMQARLPSDGMLISELSPAGVYVTTSISPSSAGLQIGDELLTVDGRTVWEWVDRALTGQPAADWRAGQTVLYQVRRGGEVVTVPVTLAPLHLSQLLLVRPGVYVLVLTSLLVATYILLARPGETAAQMLFLSALGGAFPLAMHFQVAILTHPLLLLSMVAAKCIGGSLLGSGLLHLFLIFPVVKPPLRGRERWLWALHGVNPALSPLVGLALGRSPAERLMMAWQCISWIVLVMMLASVLVVVHTHLTVRQPLARRQMRWITWGGVVGLSPYMLFTGLPEAIGGRALVSIEITAVLAVMLPLGIAFAVARYRLMDIDAVVHHSLTYVFLTLALGGVYFLLIAVLGRMALALTGRPNNTMVVFVSALVVATIFWALRSRAVRLVNRVFYYRGRVEPDRLLSEMSEQVSSARRLDEIVALLTDAIAERVGTTGGLLLVLSEDPLRLESADGTPFPLDLETVTDVWAGHGGEPLSLSMPPAWFPAAGRDRLAEYGLELIIPLFAGDQLIGLWGLSLRPSGLPYSSEETRALRTLARQAAVALQNARLMRRLEAHSQWLEEEIRERTQDLERERNRLNVILQNMADGLLVASRDGRILLINPAFEELVRLPARLLLGRPVEEALALPNLATLICRAAGEGGRLQVADLTLAERVFRASVSALPDRSGVIVVLREVTHEREVDRMKTEFISTVSHELRTPLTSVLGFAKLVHRNFEQQILPTLPDDNGTVRRAAARISENLKIIASEGERLTRLVNDVLDIAKMEAGRMEWQDRPFDLVELLRTTVDGMQALAEEKGLALYLRVAEEPFSLLLADPDRIQQVLVNLISNAIKFTQRGEVVVWARMLQANEEVHGWRPPADGTGGVVVAIKDTGIGIATEEMSRLFQRFQQLGTTLANKPKGTGLGLAICREIVAHYGGVIWAESTPGVGSVFFFAMPFVPAAASARQRPAVVEPPPGEAVPAGVPSASVLVVDDEPNFRLLLAQELGEAGYRVLEAASGSEALTLARRHHPKIILLDVLMPDMSGLDVIRVLRADPATASVPIVVLSVAEEAEHALDIGANAHLRKPVDFTRLAETIAAWTSGEHVQ